MVAAAAAATADYFGGCFAHGDSALVVVAAAFGSGPASGAG